MRFKSTIIKMFVTFAVSLGLLVSPPLATAADQTFPGVHFLVMTTGKKPEQVEARLVLAEDSIRVESASSTVTPTPVESRYVWDPEEGRWRRRVRVLQPANVATLGEMPYSSVKAATYSKSKHPRWKTSLVAAAALGIFATPLFFMKGKKHWLTFQGEGEHLALRLSKKNYALIIAAVEAQTGLKVERITE